MENPNPTVFEYSGEADSEEDDGGGRGGGFYDHGGEGDDIHPLLSGFLSKRNCGLRGRGSFYARPDVFYFPLLAQEKKGRLGEVDGLKNEGESGEEAEEEDEERGGPKSLNAGAVFALSSSGTRSLASAISAAVVGRGSLGRRREDLRQQGGDFLELLKREVRARRYVGEEGGEEERRRSRRTTQRRGACPPLLPPRPHLEGRDESFSQGAGVGRTCEGGGGGQDTEARIEEEGGKRTEGFDPAKSKGEGKALESGEGTSVDRGEDSQDVHAAFWLRRRRRKAVMRRRISCEDPITAEELYSYIRHIQDPEHPYSLEQLDVVALEHIQLCSLDEGPALVPSRPDKGKDVSQTDDCSVPLSSFQACGPETVSSLSGLDAEGGGGGGSGLPPSAAVGGVGEEADRTQDSISSSLPSSTNQVYAPKLDSFPRSNTELSSDDKKEGREDDYADDGDDTEATMSMVSSCSDSCSSSCTEEEDEEEVWLESRGKDAEKTKRLTTTVGRKGADSRQEADGGRRTAAVVKEVARCLYGSEELTAREIAYRAGKGRHMLLDVPFKPTIPHCSQATLIGLLVLAKLMRSMPLWMKAEVRIIEGKHISFKTINKQLKDKERVSAAIENPALFKVINRGLADTDAWMDITDVVLPYE